MVPLEGIEPPLLVPKTRALSVKLQGRVTPRPSLSDVFAYVTVFLQVIDFEGDPER